MSSANESSMISDNQTEILTASETQARLLAEPYIIFYLFLTASSSLTGIFGNCMTIATFAVTNALHNTRNAFIVNLAVADLLVTGIVMPYSIFGVIAGKQYFDERPTLCSFLATVCAPGCLASMYTICWISCTRQYYICKYAMYMRYFTKRNCSWIIASIWFTCVLIHFPNHIGWGRSRYSTGFLLCTLDMETLSYSFFYGCWMVTAISITFFFYFKIYQTIRKSNLSKKMITGNKKQEEKKEDKGDKGDKGGDKGDKGATGHSERNLSNEIKLAKTSFKIFIIFVATWSPTALLILMGINGFIPLSVYLYAVLLAHSNSTFNFFIYYVDNEMFRTGFKNVLKKMVGKKTNSIGMVSQVTNVQSRAH